MPLPAKPSQGPPALCFEIGSFSNPGMCLPLSAETHTQALVLVRQTAGSPVSGLPFLPCGRVALTLRSWSIHQCSAARLPILPFMLRWQGIAGSEELSSGGQWEPLLGGREKVGGKEVWGRRGFPSLGRICRGRRPTPSSHVA